MDPHTMDLPTILDNYRARRVQFVFKDGSTKVFYVEEIENQLDGWDDVIFMVTPPKDNPELMNIMLADVESAEPID